jgi:CRP/FNR family transcriptional regulator, cyclic AMP receptor protein
MTSHPALHPASLATALPDWLEQLAQRAERRTYAPETVLIREGAIEETLFIILKGRVKVYATDEAGHQMVFGVRGAGEFLGEMSLDGGPRTASAMALEATECAVLGKAMLIEQFRRDPELAYALLCTAIQRARLSTATAKDLALADVYQRVAKLMGQLAKQQPDGSMLVDEKLTQQDIAERVGSSREMVSRIFKELTKGGYVRIESRSIAVLKSLPARW